MKPKNEKIYMIRRMTDGLFSTGSSYPSFRNNGKMWKSIGSVKTHMLMVMGNFGIVDYNGEFHPDKYYDGHNPYKDCEIVESEISYKPVQNAFEFFAEYQMKKMEKKKIVSRT